MSTNPEKIKRLKFCVEKGKDIKYRTYHVDNSINEDEPANGTRIIVCTERVDKNNVNVGITYCSPKDKKNFVKEFGQYVAYERIQKAKRKNCVVTVDLSQRGEDISVHDYLKNIVVQNANDILWMIPIMTSDLV